MIDTTTPESPGWWLQWLLDKRQQELPRFEELNEYYEGTNGIPVYAEAACRDAFKRLQRVARTNWAALAVESALERMRPTGIRTGVAGDRLGDEQAWRSYQASGLDVGSVQTFEASLAMSMAYMIVGDINPDTGFPLITPEDPREVTVETDPTDRRKVRAALKVFQDPVAKCDRAYVYLPGQVWRYVAPYSGANVIQSKPVSPVQTTASAYEFDSKTVDAPGLMRVVPFPCDPKMDGTGRGAFEKHLPLLDRINYLMLNQLEIVTLQAFRQRAINIEDEQTDENGDPIDWDDLLESGPGAVWKLPATAKLWESGTLDLASLVQVCREPVKDFAAVSGTPLFYLTPEATDGSAEGASLARERLLFRTERYTSSFTESLEKVMSTAFSMLGDQQRANRESMEIIWAPPERWSIAQMADADMKAAKGSLTRRQRRERIWAMTPQEIEQAEKDDVSEALQAQGAALVDQVVNGDRNAGSVPTARGANPANGDRPVGAQA